MSLRGFQQALSELVMTPALRQRVAEGEPGALTPYELSERERRRLESLARDPGLKTGTTIHRSFRLSMLANALPRTCKVLTPPQLKALVHAYWQAHLPQSYQYLPEARRFAEFALEKIRAEGSENPFAEEVLAAELAIVALGRAAAWPGPREAAPVEGGESAAGEGGGLRLHPLCRVTPFRHDPGAVLAALAAGQAPGELPEGEHYLLLVSRGEGRVDFRPVGRDMGRVLAACAGEAGVAAADLPERAGLPPEAAAAAVAEALREGWLERCEAAVPCDGFPQASRQGDRASCEAAEASAATPPAGCDAAGESCEVPRVSCDAPQERWEAARGQCDARQAQYDAPRG